MNTRFVIPSVVAALLVAGCGESTQVARYEQGEYDGKADSRPWEGPGFGGDRAAYETALRSRVRFQNEYVRVD